jgi:hypothetical protein
MTTKLLTVRVPAPVYAALCQDAGETGVPISTHVRRLIERENDAQQIAALRRELLTSIDNLSRQAGPPAQVIEEILLLSRAIAAHLSPQLVSQVRGRLAQQSASR